MSWQLDPLLHLVATGFVILVLARAVIEKALAYDIFVANLQDYRLLPAVIVPYYVAALLIGTETIAALCLLVPALQTIGALVAAALLALYAVAMAAVLSAGRTEIACGCGGEGQVVSWALVARNAVLIVMSACLLLPTSGSPIPWSNLLIGVLAIIIVYLLLAIAEKGIETSAAIRRLDSRSPQ
jgi:Methylamine utilisation protein MauE